MHHSIIGLGDGRPCQCSL